MAIFFVVDHTPKVDGGILHQIAAHFVFGKRLKYLFQVVFGDESKVAGANFQQQLLVFVDFAGH